ncbi:hypothetical protein [Actinomadura nitritigenes]|uniref:hypothetical protein n=1 Tax=Actinomadura nitritigenes TaxID=134602 RepID=UPI003D916B6F
MTLLRPFLMQPGGTDPVMPYDAIDVREMLRGIIRGDGILVPDIAAGGLKVSQRAAGANFSVDVAAGRAAVFGDDVANQGVYLIESTGVVNVTVPSPPASGSRTHRVVAQVRDKLHNGAWTSYDWLPLLLEDTGAGTPALPGSAIALGRVTVTAGQSSVTDANIVDDRVSANLAPARFASVFTDSLRPPNPYNGEIIFRSDQGLLEFYTGSTWALIDPAPPYAILTTGTDQTVASSTNTAVKFGSEVADSHGGHDVTTNNTRYTAPRAGVYRVGTSIPWAQNSDSGKFEVWFRVNGTDDWSGGTVWKEADFITAVNYASALLRLNQNDYVEVVVYQATGATRTIDHTHDHGPRFEIQWLRSL